MTVFKTFWKILNKNKLMVIFYTVLLVGFAASNLKTSKNNISFVANKPDVLIINNDEEKGITKGLINYISDNSNIVDIQNDEEKINDALFYREVSYVIYIPENYNEDFMAGKNPEIKIKSTGDYHSSLEEMILSRYIKVANIYQKSINDEDLLISKINETLSREADVEVASKLDTNTLSKVTYYYNFASYSILACLIFIIGLILFSFNEEKIRKRTVISSTDYKKHNRILLLSNCCYSLILWLVYVIISFVLLGNIMFSSHGALYIINSLILTICATTIAFFIGSILSNKSALAGIVNVLALGSSFLCGVFVPLELLPDSVLKIAHILPTYYYISTNEKLKVLDNFNFETLKPIIVNMVIILGFSVLFIVLSNIVSRKKRKIA